MSSIALPLTNLLLGIGDIGAGIGFGVAEKKKMSELNSKSDTLKKAVTDAGNMYDHIYYLVAVNLDRFKKALDKIPSDFLDKVQAQISSDTKPGEFEKAVEIAGNVLGYTSGGTSVIRGILTLVIKLRERRAAGEEPAEPTEVPFEHVPLDGETPPSPAEPTSSFPRSPKLTTFAKGLDIGGIVFGAAGLAMTIGLGVWTLEKLNDAISNVEKKQRQIDAFKKAMTDALDVIVKAAGFPDKSYDQLTKMAATWKTISENFDSYEKSLCYAIRGYFMKKSLDEIKAMVEKESDAGKSFPDDGYTLAKTLADDINSLFDKKKTDKEVVAFFATDNPQKGLRFVFDEFFISTLRW